MTALLALSLTLACAERVEVPVGAPARDPSSDWAELLDEATSPRGVDYDHIARNQATLDRYLAWVGEHGPRKDQWGERREDRSVAFLLNAYNAAVIKGVLDRSPDGERLASVRDVSVGPFPSGGVGFFYGLRFRVDGEWVSLHVLEQQLIVNRYQEPLLHVALNCASESCPPLRTWPGGKRKLQPALKRALRKWVATDAALEIVGPIGEDGLPQGIRFNEIFAWYADDFTDWSDAGTVCEYLVDYTIGPRRDWMQAHAVDCPMETFPYDWSLNHASRPQVKEVEEEEEDEPEEEAGAGHDADTGEPHG